MSIKLTDTSIQTTASGDKPDYDETSARLYKLIRLGSELFLSAFLALIDIQSWWGQND